MRGWMRGKDIALNLLLVAALMALLTYVLGIQALRGEASIQSIQICISLACGGMLMMAVYNSALQLFSRSERAGKYFTMFCVGQSIRFLFMNEDIGRSLFPGLSGAAALALIYVPFTFGMIGLIMFVYEVFGQGRSRKVMLAAIVSVVAVTTALPLLGLHRSIWRAILGTPLALFFLGDCFWVIVTSPELKKNRLSILYLLGFVLYAVSYTFVATMYNSFPYIAVVFNFLFAVIHSILLASRAAEAARTQERARMVELQLQLQRQQYESLSDGIDMARKARHDLRHNLAALRGFVEAGDLAGLSEYLNQLSGALPHADEPQLCKNYAINAVARHYVSLARSQGVSVATRLDIPEGLPHAMELDLCVLIGNMLENAAEACARQTGDGKRRIDAVAALDGEHLTVAVSNTFDGGVTTRDGAYLSIKHAGEGIGISSIRAITQKYDGYAHFAHEGGVFEASAVVRL